MSVARRVAAVSALVFATLCAANAAQPKMTATVGAWTLTSDEIDLKTAGGDFSVPHPLTMTRTDGSTVQADRAMGNWKKKTATLYGHVSVHDVSGTFGLKNSTGGSRGPATLTTDQLQLDDIARVYDAQGHVHYAQGETTVDAQRAHLNDITHRLDLSGGVHAVQGERTLESETATYNTITGEGEADGNATLIFPGAAPTLATPKPIVIH